MNEEYRIEIKVKNNLLIKKIEEAGYKTVGEFCRLNNMTNCTSKLGDIINMKRSPLRSDGQWQSIILKCSDILNCMPDDFFTHAHLTTILKTNTRSIQINEAEMKFMLENKHNLSLEEDLHKKDGDKKLLNIVNNNLTPRESKILNLKYGLEDGKEMTLGEIGEMFKISVSRVKQIENKALRKLRHPRNSEELRDFIV